MYEKEADFKEYSTVIAICPECSRHYALRLNLAFVTARRGQEISVVCRSCAELRISKLKTGKDNRDANSFTESDKPVDVVVMLPSVEDVKKFWLDL
jgi:uncharacterized Zn finger protein